MTDVTLGVVPMSEIAQTFHSDCFVNGDPGAIVTGVGATANGNLSIALP